MQWDIYFSKSDKQNGEALVSDNAVKELELIGNVLKAKVDDEKIYNVEIPLNGMAVEKGFVCDCNKFKSYGSCSHIVAALEKWFEEYINNDVYGFSNNLDNPFQEVEDNNDYLLNFVQNSEQDYKDKFLADFLSQDNRLLLEFLINSEKKLSETDMFLIAKYLEELCVKFRTDRKRVWMRERDLAYSLDEFFQMVIKPLFEHGNKLNAFILAGYIYDIINVYELAESTTGVRELENELVTFMESLLNDIPDNEEEVIFNYFLDRFPYTKDSITGKFVRDTFSNTFNDENHIEAKLDLLNNLLTTTDSRVTFTKGSTKNNLISSYFAIAQNSEDSEKHINEFVQNNPDDLDVQVIYYNYLKNKGDYEGSLEVVNDILGKTKDKLILHEHFLNERKELSSKLDNLSNEVDDLINLALNFDNETFDYTSELKSKLSDDEWNNVKQQLMDKYKGSEKEAQFLNYVGDYAGLFDLISENKDFNTFLNHFDILYNEFPKESMNLYADFLENIALTDRNRLAYKKIIEHFKKILKLDSGKEIVQNLIDSWKVKFKKRRALISEIEKFELEFMKNN